MTPKLQRAQGWWSRVTCISVGTEHAAHVAHVLDLDNG